MTLPTRHSIRNSSLGGLRSRTLPLVHGGYSIFQAGSLYHSTRAHTLIQVPNKMKINFARHTNLWTRFQTHIFISSSCFFSKEQYVPYHYKLHYGNLHMLLHISRCCFQVCHDRTHEIVSHFPTPVIWI